MPYLSCSTGAPGFSAASAIDQRRQRLEIDGDQFGRVLGEIAAFGKDHRDRLADMPHLVVRQQRLLRVEEGVLDLGGPFARQRQLRVGNRRQDLRQFGAGQHVGHAGHRRGARQIDRTDAGVRDLAAHEDGVQRVGKLEVGDELAAAGQQAAILAAQDRLPDITVALRLSHRPISLAFVRRIVSAAAMTAVTMFW